MHVCHIPDQLRTPVPSVICNVTTVPAARSLMKREESHLQAFSRAV